MKGVILAAGYGSRFLPGTKTIPKEMFPLIDTPAIELIVQEFMAAGIRDILIVTSRRKKPLEDYFDREVELEVSFNKDGMTEKLKRIEPLDANVFFLRQKHMAGTGNALLLVQPFVGDSPFVVAYPDDVVLGKKDLTNQLVEVFRRTGKTVLTAQEVPTGDISRFGVLDVDNPQDEAPVRGLVEKPAPGTEPSRLVSFGRYLYTPEIFQALKTSLPKVPKTREFTQTDAINLLAEQGKVTVKVYEGKIMDVGTPMGYLQSVVEYGLERPEFRQPLLDFLKEVVQREG